MAIKQVVLQFAERNLKKARENAQVVARLVKQAAKDIKDVDRRKEVLKDLRERQKRERAEFKAEGKRQQLERRGLRGRNRFGGFEGGRSALASADPTFSTLNALREKGTVTAGLFRGGGLASGASILSGASEGVSGLIAGFGPIAALAGAVATLVVPIVEERFELLISQRVTEGIAKIERRLAEADLERRFREDPLFAEQKAQEALARERSLEAAGFHRRAQTLADFDFN